MENQCNQSTTNGNSSCRDDYENCFRFYEKAIEGRNFHYKNYNTWANYYAIFNGALFIGYYTIMNNFKCNNMANNNLTFISFLVVLLGLITSICWHLTVKGHYHWMISWIRIVQKYEKKLAKLAAEKGIKKWRVYSVYINDGENSFHKNISSQKLTSRFTFFIELAWSILAIYLVYQYLSELGLCQNCCKIILISLSFLFIFFINVMVHLIFSLGSDVSKMKGKIC